MRMHFLSGGRLRMRAGVFEADAAPDTQLELPVLCALLRHPQGNVLFDTGCHPSVIGGAETRWGGMAKFMTPIGRAEENAIDELGSIGFSADDVDVVVCSHLHPDHCGCNGLFGRATIICHRRELEAAQASGSERAGYLRVEWDHSRPSMLIDGEHDLFGDGRIVLLPMTGHTPGLICALVTLDRDGCFFLASDAVSLRANLDLDHAPRNTWDVDLQLRSFGEIRRIEARGVEIICGHDAAQWRGLRKGRHWYE